MNNIEKRIRRLTLASIGAIAKSVDKLDDLLEDKGDDRLDDLVEKGKSIIHDGKEANEELRRDVEKQFDKFVDKHRSEKREINIEDMSKEEREALLQRLTESLKDDEA